MPSYHDVVVFVDGKQYRIADNYAYRLICTKVGGWQLWHIWDGKEQQIGGEFHGNAEFRIEVEGIAICGDVPILGIALSPPS